MTTEAMLKEELGLDVGKAIADIAVNQYKRDESEPSPLRIAMEDVFKTENEDVIVGFICELSSFIH